MTPKQALDKAIKLGKRIPELEPIISKDAYWSYLYAKDVIKGRWKQAEPVISQNAQCSYYYAKDVIEGRWELAEPAISKNAHHSCRYAKFVIKGKLPDFMHNAVLLSNHESAKEYVRFIK